MKAYIFHYLHLIEIDSFANYSSYYFKIFKELTNFMKELIIVVAL